MNGRVGQMWGRGTVQDAGRAVIMEGTLSVPMRIDILRTNLQPDSCILEDSFYILREGIFQRGGL